MTQLQNGLYPEPFPPWLIFHVPHDSTFIPPEVREKIFLSDEELAAELISITDHRTLSLFASKVPETQVIRAPVSRLVVDVERFEDDRQEPMAARGMGVIYTVTSGLIVLREKPRPVDRELLLQAYYRPHHARLEAAVAATLSSHNRCLIIDCHSFPSTPLPYELANTDLPRPDICIGTDEFHTDEDLAKAFVTAFQRGGWQVSLNDPFAGALVPASRYRQDRRVSSVMVEVSRHLYLNEEEASPLLTYSEVAQQIKECCAIAINNWNLGGVKI